MASSDSSTCIFPGCTRPVPRDSSPGRPPQYCDLPEHTRWRAWKERQRLAQEAENAEEAVRSEQEEGAAAKPAQGTEPVTAARLRADDLLTRFAVQADQLGATLESATRAFATMSDPAAAEAQVEAARLAAARQVSEADSARLEAENRRLLKTIRHQATEFKILERMYPGITRLEKDETGNLVLPEMPGDELSRIIEECSKEYK